MAEKGQPQEPMTIDELIDMQAELTRLYQGSALLAVKKAILKAGLAHQGEDAREAIKAALEPIAKGMVKDGTKLGVKWVGSHSAPKS